MRPEPVGFRWYLHSSLPVSWLADEVMPAIRYLRHTERLPVVNVHRGWLHGTHLEVIAYSDDGRPVPWTQVLARMRPPAPEPGEESEGDHPHGTFEWIANSDLRSRPEAQASSALRERALTRMIDSMAVTLEPGEHVLIGVSAPVGMVAEIMLATADAHPLGIRYGTISFRADGEAFLNRSRVAADRRPEFEHRLAGDRPVLRSLVERMLDATDTPSAASWRRTACYCMGMFDGAALAGADVSRADVSRADVSRADVSRADVSRADVSRADVSRADVSRADVPPDDAGFSSYRLLLDLLYTQLPLLGVLPTRRYYLCWAIAEIVDEMAGVTWR